MSKRFLALALVLPLAGGCATKRDIRDLQSEIVQMQAAQDRLLREIQQQNALVLDSLHVQDVRIRGDFMNQMVQIERQLVQIQELTGQGQQRLSELRETLRSREEALQQVDGAINPAEVGDPDELFASAEAALERQSISTARAGFEEFIQAFPLHFRTPQARLHLAGILHDEGQVQESLEEYSRVLELHPNSTEAASALFRAALIEHERGNTDRARSMLSQLTAAYPGSPEAPQAREELRRMP